jgi:hypothetical protein
MAICSEEEKKRNRKKIEMGGDKHHNRNIIKTSNELD